MQLKTGTLSTERRDFLKKVGSFTVMSTLGVGFFTACSSDDDDVQPSTPPGDSDETGITIDGNTITIDLTKQPALNTNGGWLLIPEAEVLVVNDGSFNALTSICTHSACSRNWTYGNGVFECTCHGSRFDTNGQVLRGPANQPLRSFATTVANNTLTIQK